ncbi:MAG TPA: TldD/PmbA family protein [Drouetiella sp.]
MISESESKRIIDLAIAHAGKRADGVEVKVTSSNFATSRFANNSMTQNQAPEHVTVSVRVISGQRQLRLSTDNISDSGIEHLVDNAITAVKLLPEDSTVLPLPDLCLTKTHDRGTAFNRYDRGTGEMSADERSNSVNAMIDVAKKQSLSCAGTYGAGGDSIAIGNSNGMFHYHNESGCECSVTVVAPNSSGWAKVHDPRSMQVDARSLAQSAAKNAVLSADPRDVPPGRYTVILPPSAVVDLLGYLWGDFSATSHIDKLSSLLGKVGQKVFGENINIKDDVFHSMQSGAPFDGEGLPRTVVTLVENGVVKNLVYGRKSAAKMHANPTGHGVSEPSPEGEFPVNLVMTGGAESLDDMVKSTERGILLSRVWYVRLVDPTTILLTGMTRDGTFLVENGKISYGIKNLRFNVSVIDMLNNVLALGPSVRAAGEDSFPAVVPAMKVANFNFSSSTKF